MKTLNHCCREQFGKKLYKLTLNGDDLPQPGRYAGQAGVHLLLPRLLGGKGRQSVRLVSLISKMAALEHHQRERLRPLPFCVLLSALHRPQFPL